MEIAILEVKDVNIHGQMLSVNPLAPLLGLIPWETFL